VRRKGEEAAVFYVAAAVGDWLAGWLAIVEYTFGLPWGHIHIGAHLHAALKKRMPATGLWSVSPETALTGQFDRDFELRNAFGHR